MAIRTLKPTTPGQRGMTTQDFSTITSKRPVKSLLLAKKRGSGRNNQGRITTRHKGGGAKSFIKMIKEHITTS
jgi:large subunit ribosomal protein L2